MPYCTENLKILLKLKSLHVHVSILKLCHYYNLMLSSPLQGLKICPQGKIWILRRGYFPAKSEGSQIVLWFSEFHFKWSIQGPAWKPTATGQPEWVSTSDAPGQSWRRKQGWLRRTRCRFTPHPVEPRFSRYPWARAAASPGNKWEIQILGPRPRPAEPETGGGVQHLCFNELSDSEAS